MKALRFWVYAFFLIAALFWGYLFNLENAHPVSVVFFGISLPTLSLGVWLLMFSLAGVVAGMLVSLLPTINHKRKLSVLNKQNRQLEQEVQLLRSQSLRD